MTEDQRENREERRAIMQVEKVPEVEIEKLFKSKPDVYGIADDESKQGDMF